jgi:predicted N-acyltransferase
LALALPAQHCLRSLPLDPRTGCAVSASSEQVRIAHGAAQLPESQWQNLVVGRPALRLEVLKAIENAAARPLRVQTFLLEDHMGLAAAAVCEPIPESSDYNPLDALLFGRVAGIIRRLGVSTQPLLVFKTPLGRQSSVVLRPAHPAEQQRVLDSLLDAIEQHAAKAKLGIAFIDVTAEDDLLWSALRTRRYVDSEIDATARMEIEWSDFDGYVDCQRRRSKNAAHAARRERNSNRRSGVSIRQLRLGAADAQAFYELTRDHYRHKNGRDPLYGPEFLPLLSQLLADDLLIFEAVRESKRVAMLAVVRSGSVGWMAWLGIELRDRPNDYTYANINFYHAADWAPALGLKTLLYGTAALEAKLKRGCRLFDCRVFYRPHRRFLRAFAQPYFQIHQAWYRKKSR